MRLESSQACRLAHRNKLSEGQNMSRIHVGLASEKWHFLGFRLHSSVVYLDVPNHGDLSKVDKSPCDDS
jgi:hypothetical protein